MVPALLSVIAMKTTVTVTALQRFDWNGQTYAAGDAVHVTPIDAVVLTKKHKVSLAKRKAVKLSPPQPHVPLDPMKQASVVKELTVEAPKRGRYRRRDLRADEVPEPPPAVEEKGPDADTGSGSGDSTHPVAPQETDVSPDD